MILRARLTNPTSMMRLGMTFFLISVVSLRFLRPIAGVSQDGIDFVAGLCFGLSIGLNLLSIWLKSGRSRGDGGTCAS